MAYVSALDMAEKRADNADRWAKLNQRAHERRLRFVGDMNQGRDREEYKRLLSNDEITAARAHENQMQKDRLAAETEQGGYKAWGMQHQGESAAHENRLASESRAAKDLEIEKERRGSALEVEKERGASALEVEKQKGASALEVEKERGASALEVEKQKGASALDLAKEGGASALEVEKQKGGNSVLTEAEKNKGLQTVEQMRSREAQNAFEDKALITAMSIGQRPLTGAEVEAAKRIMFENEGMTFQQAMEEVRKRGAANK